jgi:hypothetical protein
MPPQRGVHAPAHAHARVRVAPPRAPPLPPPPRRRCRPTAAAHTVAAAGGSSRSASRDKRSPSGSGGGGGSRRSSAPPPPPPSAPASTAGLSGEAAMRAFAADETLFFEPSAPTVPDALRVVYAYPNSYSVGITSLGYQLVWAFFATHPGVAVSRLFLDANEPLPQARVGVLCCVCCVRWEESCGDA